MRPSVLRLAQWQQSAWVPPKLARARSLLVRPARRPPVWRRLRYQPSDTPRAAAGLAASGQMKDLAPLFGCPYRNTVRFLELDVDARKARVRTPESIRREPRALRQSLKLGPLHAWMGPVHRPALGESTVGAGDDVFATDHTGVALDPLRDGLGMLDHVGRM